jgi:PPOX class probable F420-dependent enzyme
VWRDEHEAEVEPVHLTGDEALARAAAADHGILATINRTGAPDLVPVCFAIVGDAVAIPIDSLKPKRSTALGRVRNLERDPRATLLLERWDAADWNRLWWVRLTLRRADLPAEATAELERALRDRYPQYAGAQFVEILTFRLDGVTGWEAAERR